MNVHYQLEEAHEEINRLNDELDETTYQLSEAQESATDLMKHLLMVRNLVKSGNPEIALKAIEEALDFEYEGVNYDELEC